MRSLPLRRPFVALLTLALAGCGAAVQDRTISFSTDGKQASIEHGRDGIFVVEDDGVPTKVFQPGPEVLAASAPLWSPTDKRLIFTTAEPVKKPDHPPTPHDPDPAGDLFFPQPVIYTCWLRDAPRDSGAPPEPRPLFTAPCDHPGYVAANLAVRWRPDGRAVLYVKQTAEHRHELFAYNLETQTSESVFPYAGASLVFDWTPDNTRLCCVLGGANDDHSRDGIWVGAPGGDDWWHVPDSFALAGGGLGSGRPAWSNDGKRFAFVTGLRIAPKGPMEYTLRLGDSAARTVQTIAVGPRRYRDLRWAPNGGRFGVVIDARNNANAPLTDEPGGSLCFVAVGGKLSAPITPQPVRSFAGWDSTGERSACVAPDLSPCADGAAWAFLFLADPHGRDALLIQGKDDATPREVFAGMRLTFPHWSPTEPKLSLWATFTPPYHSAVVDLVGRGLRPGDPAAIYDTATATMSWKAVNAHERNQVGNYYLLKRDYAEAWRWYEQAGKDDAARPDERTAEQAWQDFVEGESTLFLRSYCLTKLGRSEEAAAKREQWERASLPASPGNPKDLTATLYEQMRQRLDENGVDALLFRDLLAAEAFLSVDAAEDGEAFFRDGLRDAPGDEARLSKALVLGQMLLMRSQWGEYADLTTDTAAPLLLRLVKTEEGGKPGSALPNTAAMALLPLFATDFLEKLLAEQVRTLDSRWRALRERADGDDKRLAVDLVLRAVGHSLGWSQDEKESADRVAANPARAYWLGDKDVADRIQARRLLPALAGRLLLPPGR